MAGTSLGYIAVKRESSAGVAVKPSHFLRFKDGDLKRDQKIIMNSPIQNNRALSLEAVPGKIESGASFNFDLDVNECVHWFAAALGSLSSADISSGTDASVFRHTIDTANSLPSLSIEQGKGNLTDTTNHRQNYECNRAFGAYVDSFTLSGSDGILGLAVEIQALGVFQKASLIGNAAAGSSVVLSLDSAEGLVATSDTVNIYDETPQSETDAIASLSLSANTITIGTLGNSYTVANKAKVELVPQSPSYGTAPKTMSFTHLNAKFGADLTAAASATEMNIENWELQFMNNLEPRYGSKRASPSVIAPKRYKTIFKFTKYFENILDRDYYISIRPQACILTITDNVIVSATDTGNAKYTVELKMSKIIYNSRAMETGNDALYAAVIECECLYDDATSKQLQVLVTNAKAGTEYTA